MTHILPPLMLCCTCTYLVDHAGPPLLKDLTKEFYTNAKFNMILWEDIGIMLEIDDRKLNRIKADNAGDSRSCLREMLREWLKIINPQPSWHALVKALEDVGNSDQGFVQALKSKYC